MCATEAPTTLGSTFVPSLADRATAAFYERQFAAERERQEREDEAIRAERARRLGWWQEIDGAILAEFGIERPTEPVECVEVDGLTFGIEQKTAWQNRPNTYALALFERCADCGKFWCKGDSILTLADLGWWLENPRSDHYDHGPGACVPYRFAEPAPGDTPAEPAPQPSLDERLVALLRAVVREEVATAMGDGER